MYLIHTAIRFTIVSLNTETGSAGQTIQRHSEVAASKTPSWRLALDGKPTARTP